MVNIVTSQTLFVHTFTMRYPLPREYTAALFLLVFPLAVLCCEGDCMTGVTTAFVGNYSSPVRSVLSKIMNKISSRILPNQNYPLTKTSLGYLEPIVSAYHEKAPATLQTAIFPGYFHGKCQRNLYAANGTLIGNADPPGCPNPDCPVVCGTPGSMVHHYPVLKRIAFDSTVTLLQDLTAPDSDAYKQVEADLHNALKTRRYIRRSIGSELRLLLDGIKEEMEKECGKDLVKCSWELAMKEYILEFP